MSFRFYHINIERMINFQSNKLWWKYLIKKIVKCSKLIQMNFSNVKVFVAIIYAYMYI